MRSRRPRRPGACSSAAPRWSRSPVAARVRRSVAAARSRSSRSPRPSTISRAALADLRERAAGGRLPRGDATRRYRRVAVRRRIREGLDVPVVGPTGAAAELALDKRLQLAAAARAGLHVPPTDTSNSVEELMALTDFPFSSSRPTRWRSATAVSGAGRLRVRHAAELDGRRACLDGEPMLAQPLMGGVGEGLFGLAGRDGLIALSAHRRVRMMNPAGLRLERLRLDRGRPRAGRRRRRGCSTEAGWQGMFMLEFLRGARRDPVVHGAERPPVGQHGAGAARRSRVSGVGAAAARRPRVRAALSTRRPGRSAATSAASWCTC